MNPLNMLQEFTIQIMDDSFASRNQHEEKMIQVFDLCHFIQIYKQFLKVIDFEQKINIVNDDGILKGIYFCDLLYNTNVDCFFSLDKVRDLMYRLKIKELWFVIVEEGFYRIDLNFSKEFIKNNNIESLFDKVLYFNFSQSIIKNLK